MFNRKPAAAAAPPPPTSDVKATIDATHLTHVAGSGSIAIVEFSDFQCPFCARHATETLPALRKDLIDSGKARYIMLNLPLAMHPQAIPAAEAAECAAAQGKYWEMHDLLFEKQKELANADYMAYARRLGLDAERYATCLSDDRTMAKIKADEKEAERLGVNTTPALFVGRVRPDGGVDLLRRVNGARPLSVFTDEVAKLKG